MNNQERLNSLADRMDDFSKRLSWEMSFDEIEAKIHGWAVLLRTMSEGKEYPLADFYQPVQWS